MLDASKPPADFRIKTDYQGLNLIFALGDENADARIEDLIAAHSAPKSLTVVSSDRRIRRAAQRRRARSLSADEFLDLLDDFRPPNGTTRPPGISRRTFTRARIAPVGGGSSSLACRVRRTDEAPETKEAFGPGATLLTDAEIARIQKEIDSES